MQRVYEIQSNWDEREKLRHFAISRPPVMPPWPIVSPSYSPDLVSLYPRPSEDALRNDKGITNSGPSGYNFIQKNDNTIRLPINHPNSMKSMNSILTLKNSLEQELRDTKKEIERIKTEKYHKIQTNPKIYNNSEDNNYKNFAEKYLNEDNSPALIDYDKYTDEICSNLKNQNVNKEIIKNMIKGKNKEELEKFVDFINKHPQVISEKEDSNLKKDEIEIINPKAKTQQADNPNKKFNNSIIKINENPKQIEQNSLNSEKSFNIRNINNGISAQRNNHSYDKINSDLKNKFLSKSKLSKVELINSKSGKTKPHSDNIIPRNGPIPILI